MSDVNALALADQLDKPPPNGELACGLNHHSAKTLRRQHEAIKTLREALESMCEGDSQAIAEAEALGIPFPDEMLTEYRKAQQALEATKELR